MCHLHVNCTPIDVNVSLCQQMLVKGILPVFVSNTIHITSHKNVYLS